MTEAERYAYSARWTWFSELPACLRVAAEHSPLVCCTPPAVAVKSEEKQH